MVQPAEQVEMQVSKSAPKSIMIASGNRPADTESMYKPLPTQKLAIPCYYEGCTHQATFLCTAIGCIKNYGCGRGVCEFHKSKRNVQYDRYTKPPQFCQDCEPRVVKWIWINTCIPFFVFLVVLCCLMLIIVQYYNSDGQGLVK